MGDDEGAVDEDLKGAEGGVDACGLTEPEGMFARWIPPNWQEGWNMSTSRIGSVGR